ncbi:MAG: TauD/TfdA family dioxygenase [Chthoniobacterales bacterium]|nr:TauD/TfdA family dioxygenase [Chthoniobacterales bacterium]
MLLLSPEVTTALRCCASALPTEQLTDTAAVERLRCEALKQAPLGVLASLVRSVVEEQGFAQVRGLPDEGTRVLFPALAALLGSPFIDPAEGSAVIGAHVRPSESLMGNQLRHLPLHTDYSMLANPARLTMSLCIEPDPTPGWGALQIADIEAMCFGVESDLDIQQFMSVALPFAGRNAAEGVDILESPIISRDAASGRFLARYHRSRIRQGFRVRGTLPTPEQSSMMLAFERKAAENVETLHLQSGDITVIDNHRTLHARTRCSIIVKPDGSTSGRKMQFLFAH